MHKSHLWGLANIVTNVHSRLTHTHMHAHLHPDTLQPPPTHTHTQPTHPHTHIIIIINLSTARVVGAPQMIFQPVFSIFPCSPLPSVNCRTPGLSIPWCCLPTSSSVCLVFFTLSLCLAIWFWPDMLNGKHDHTTAVCVSLRSSGSLHVVQLSARSWHGLPL